MPYISAWSEEVNPPFEMVEVAGRGIGYADEVLADRDRHGLLWDRMPHRLGVGRPQFGRVHPGRQRRAMSRLWCQVCAGAADWNNDGMLFLWKDHRMHWPGWPDRIGVTEPPICRPCVAVSARLCPAMRKGAVLIRARRFDIVGARGWVYTGGRSPQVVGDALVAFDHPTIRWVRAVALVRELRDCTLIELDKFADEFAEEVPNCS